MSRVGKKPIEVPAGVTVTVAADNTSYCKRTKRRINSSIQSRY